MRIEDVNSSTYSLGSIESIVNCESILVFSSDSMDTKLSVENVGAMYEKIVSKSTYIPYLIITKNSSDEYFYYELSKATGSGIKTGFDEIIYLDKTQTNPLGYTELQTKIGKSTNLTIRINLSTGINDDTINDLRISFKLEETKESLNTTKNIIGKELYEYATVNDVKNAEIRKYEPYVNNVNCLVNDKNRSLYLNDRVIIHEGNDLKIHKLNILTGKEVDPFRNNFQNYKIGQYGTDLAIYAWNKTKVGDKYQIDYSINSLTISNYFGNLKQYVYTKDNDGCCTIPDIFEGTEVAVDVDILYATSKYLVCKGIFEDGTSTIKVLNTDEESTYWVNLPEDFICISEWEALPEIIRLSHEKINFSTDSVREILEKYPDLYSTYLDTRIIPSFYLRRKIGDWYLIQKTINNGSSYILAGKYSTVYMTEEDLKRLIIVNNNTVIIKEDDYYLLYSGIKKTWHTERYRAVFFDSSFIEYKGINMADIKSGVSNEVSNDTYKNYYDKGYIKIIQKTDQLCNTVLDRYRRNRYPDISHIPNIVDACNGIIFYIEDGKINYL